MLRRYNPAHDEPGAVKARREFQALRILQRAGVPAPKPLLLDETGDLLGLPGIAVAFVAGRQIEPPTEAPRWGKMAATNARMLAKIHRTPFAEVG